MGSDMSKKERLEALKEALDISLPSTLQNYDAKAMLWTFITGFKILRYRKDSKGWTRVWYTLIAVPLFIDGYVRDVRVNSTTGKKLFGKYAEFGTLTATLKRIKKAEPAKGALGSDGYDSKYGFISAKKYDLSRQICEVLDDYDPGHC